MTGNPYTEASLTRTVYELTNGVFDDYEQRGVSRSVLELARPLIERDVRAAQELRSDAPARSLAKAAAKVLDRLAGGWLGEDDAVAQLRGIRARGGYGRGPDMPTARDARAVALVDLATDEQGVDAPDGPYYRDRWTGEIREGQPPTYYTDPVTGAVSATPPLPPAS